MANSKVISSGDIIGATEKEGIVKLSIGGEYEQFFTLAAAEAVGAHLLAAAKAGRSAAIVEAGQSGT